MKTTPYKHYARLTPQPIEYMQQAMSAAEFRGFCRGNIIKYACRMGFKDSFATCAKKIEDYARWIRESEEGKPLTFRAPAKDSNKPSNDIPPDPFDPVNAEEEMIDGIRKKITARDGDVVFKNGRFEPAEEGDAHGA